LSRTGFYRVERFDKAGGMVDQGVAESAFVLVLTAESAARPGSPGPVAGVGLIDERDGIDLVPAGNEFRIQIDAQCCDGGGRIERDAQHVDAAGALLDRAMGRLQGGDRLAGGIDQVNARDRAWSAGLEDLARLGANG
jgi:hypothetical protein